MRSRIVATLLSVAFFALACSHAPAGRGAGEIETSPQSQSSFKVETVIPNLEVVWSIVWTPDGRMFFTERPGRVRVFEIGNWRRKPCSLAPIAKRAAKTGLRITPRHRRFA